jgi:hypothetical protein
MLSNASNDSNSHSHSLSRTNSISMAGTSGRMASTRFSIDVTGIQGTVLCSLHDICATLSNNSIAHTADSRR